MNETVRQALTAEMHRDEAEREQLRKRLQKAFTEYARLSDEFTVAQGRIDDIRQALGLGLEDRVEVTPPELEAVV